eukprot:scaffold285875_cov27-Tisochrysis_lutea.AAC.2
MRMTGCGAPEAATAASRDKYSSSIVECERCGGASVLLRRERWPLTGRLPAAARAADGSPEERPQGREERLF